MDGKPRYCEFLGLKGDPDTALAYLSPWNCCHKVRPVVPVELEHQRNYCLAGNYTKCPIYAGQQTKLPLGGPRAGTKPRALHLSMVGGRRFIIPTVALLVVAFVIWRLFAGGVFGKGGENLPTPIVTATDTKIVPTAQTPLPKTPLARPSATITPSSTPSPTSRPSTPTPTMKLVHGLETPIGTDYTFIIHMIQEGESLDLLANHYGTTVQAIQAVNYKLPVPLWAGKVIVIPVMMVNVEGIPPFEAYQVTEDGLMIEALATQLSVDLTQLIYYNDLYQGYLLSKGEWLLVPH